MTRVITKDRMEIVVTSYHLIFFAISREKMTRPTSIEFLVQNTFFYTLQPHGTPRTFMKELRLWIDPAEKPSGSEPTGLGTRTGRSTGSSG